MSLPVGASELIAINSHIQVCDLTGNTNFVDGVPENIIWDGNALGSVKRGTDLSWASADPTKVTVGVAGIYDLNCMATWSGGVDTFQQVNLLVNGSAVTKDAFWPGISRVLTASFAFGACGFTILGREFAAGDYLEVQAVVNGGSATDLLYASLTVTRRA